MKRISAFLLLICMLFCLIACETKDTTRDTLSAALQTETPNPQTGDTNPSESTGNKETITPSPETPKPTESTKPNQTTKPTETTKPVHTHFYSPATCTTPAKCACGATKGATNDHIYASATCTKPQTCKACGATKGSALGHNYVLGECTKCKDYSSSYCPKLYLTGDMSAMTGKKDVRNVSFEYRSKQQIITGATKIKIQGTSSLQYNKKITPSIYTQTQIIHRKWELMLVGVRRTNIVSKQTGLTKHTHAMLLQQNLQAKSKKNTDY